MKPFSLKLGFLLLCFLTVILVSSFTDSGETKVSYCDTQNDTPCTFYNLSTGATLHSSGNYHEYTQ